MVEQSRLTHTLLLLWLLMSGVYAGAQTSAGEDLWWTLAAGRYIAQQGTVPDHDVFSYATEGARWQNQEWLTQVLDAYVYDHLGGDSLVLLKIALAVSFALLLGWVSIRRSRSPLLGTAATAAALLLCGENLDLRAQIFTFLGMAALLALLDSHRRGARRALLGVPVVLLLWVNLHYGFIFGLGVVFSYFLAETTKSFLGWPAEPLPLSRSLAIGLTGVAALIACLVNPQGVSALTFPFEILESTSPWKGVIEWKPAPIFARGAPTLLGSLMAVQIAAALLALWRAPRRLDLTDLGLVAGTAAMALSSRRFVPLFAFVGTPFLARNLAVLTEDWLARSPRASALVALRGSLATSAIALLAAAATGLGLLAHARTAFAQGLFTGMVHAELFPNDAVDFLARNGVPGRLYNFYPWGGYLLHRLPNRQIYMDGRAHAVYSPELWHERRKIEGVRMGWGKTLERRGAEVVVHHSGYRMPLQLRRRQGWERVYDDGLAVILVRDTPATSPWLERHAAGGLWYPSSAGARIFLAESRAREGDIGAAADEILAVLESDPEQGLRAAGRKFQAERNAADIAGDLLANYGARAITDAILRFGASREKNGQAAQ